jgi:hypothetical protein
VPAAPAVGALPCWHDVVRDAYDGRLDHRYAASCYREALDVLPPGTPPRVRAAIRDAGDEAEARALRAGWLRGIAADARAAPQRRFPSPSRARLLARLRPLARRDGFTVVSVDLHRPRGLAPELVLRGEPRLLARRLPEIVDAVDPRTAGDRRAYEAILIELRDERGVPAVAFANRLRDEVSGTQWARSPDLLPFLHA